MTKHWPPAAAVEDEITSLAREYGSPISDSESDDDKAPPGSQGAVNQQPIILDITDVADCPREKNLEFQQSAPQTESFSTPLPQPTQVKEGKRVSFNPPQKTDEHLQRKPASAAPVNQDPIQRGRPQVSRICTNLRGDNSGPTAASHHPTTSQYVGRPTATNSQERPDRRQQPSLLPPATSAQGLPERNPRRALSANPHPVRSGRISPAIESSDSDTWPLRQRYRSKSRVRPRENPGEQYRSADESSFGRRERRKSLHRRPDRQSPEIVQSTTAYQRLPQGHGSVHGHPTPPQTPSITRESPYSSSAAEDSVPRRTRARSRARRPDYRHSRDSPYSSAAEDSGKTQKPSEGVRDPGSIKRANKPHLDLYDIGLVDCPKFHSQSLQTPKIIEDDLRRAFEENQKKLPKYISTHSSRPSPLSSPPASPAQTEHRPRDYFEGGSPQNNAYKQRSRPQSTEESPLKPLTSLLTAAIGGSMSSKAISGFPRSSPSPLDTPLSGSHSSVPSAQRSRRSSPVPGEPIQGPRNVSRLVKEDMHPSRSSPFVVQHDHQASRPSSACSWDEQALLHAVPHYAQASRPGSRPGSRDGSFSEARPARASGVVLHQDRASSRSGSYLPATTIYAPPAYDQSQLRSNQRRTYSTTSGAVVTPSSSQHPLPRPHVYHAYTSPSAKTQPSPSSATNGSQTISFPKCPYAHPTTDISNWYTIRGLRDFLICTTCIQVISVSVLRGHCVPTASRAPAEGVTCSLSKPWIRIAIARFLQNNTADISLLDSLSRLPDQTLPCPGKNSDVRKWYHITDPTTRLPMANSDSCGACVRSAELIFPELRQQKLFERPVEKLMQERRCMLNPTSKHFYRIANELDKLAGYIRKNDLRSKDIVKFGELIKSKSKSRECQKDTMLATPLWHFIPALPQFTICEECFEDVVWPLGDKPIARDVQKTLQPVPSYLPGQQMSGLSCHLYSERMRQAFRQAVDSNDFAYLKRVALARFHAEQRLQGIHKALMRDMASGIDRRVEVEKNLAEWKAFE
ncbi:hypothetical protein DV735_g1318, partial [Chaetothyriales sp. CBS 134920]